MLLLLMRCSKALSRLTTNYRRMNQMPVTPAYAVVSPEWIQLMVKSCNQW